MKFDIQYNPDYLSKRWLGYFDLLGVKVLQKSENQISIFVALSSAINKFKERVTTWDNIGYAWFSDTFIFYAADDSKESAAAVDCISRWFFYFLITGGMPVRGAISCGLFYSDKANELFFGEALIEAYEYGEAQDWIGFILCPSAEEKLKQLGLPAEHRLNYSYEDIPYNKQTRNLKQNLPACIIGNWVSVNDQNPIIAKLKQMQERITDDNIKLKYDRTISFIQRHKRVLVSENDR
jgi:hypothetical protein